jgi:hypothetical protein
LLCAEILSAVHALNLKHLAMAGCEITHRSGGGLCRLILVGGLSEG